MKQIYENCIANMNRLAAVVNATDNTTTMADRANALHNGRKAAAIMAIALHNAYMASKAAKAAKKAEQAADKKAEQAKAAKEQAKAAKEQAKAAKAEQALRDKADKADKRRTKKEQAKATAEKKAAAKEQAKKATAEKRHASKAEQEQAKAKAEQAAAYKWTKADKAEQEQAAKTPIAYTAIGYNGRGKAKQAVAYVDISAVSIVAAVKAAAKEQAFANIEQVKVYPKLDSTFGLVYGACIVVGRTAATALRNGRDNVDMFEEAEKASKAVNAYVWQGGRKAADMLDIVAAYSDVADMVSVAAIALLSYVTAAIDVAYKAAYKAINAYVYSEKRKAENEKAFALTTPIGVDMARKQAFISNDMANMIATFTPIEQAIIDGLSCDKAYRDIATDIGKAVSTIGGHVANIRYALATKMAVTMPFSHKYAGVVDVASIVADMADIRRKKAAKEQARRDKRKAAKKAENVDLEQADKAD